MKTHLNMEDLQKLKANVLPLKPVYEPYNDIAHQVLEQVLDMLSNVPTTSVNRNKYCLILSSILVVAQTLATQVKGGISIPKTKKVWYEYPRVSIKAIDRVRNDLLNNNIITQIPDTGRQHILQLEDGSWKNVGVQSVYSINDQVLKLKGLLDAEFIEVARPTVLVGEYEDWIVRKRRKDQGLRKPKMNTTKVKSKFGVLYRVTSKDIERLNTFYRDHPLALPRLDNGSQKYAACCTRIYHDGSMDSGGRLYGAWSDMGSHYRLQSTIDGETVVEIDLNASQPTLFSSLMGMKMDVGESWNDLYESIVSNFPLQTDEDVGLKREKLKSVAAELIGTGNPNKSHPSKDSKYSFSKDYLEWDMYRYELIRAVPSLESLDNSYYNGTGFISFHESEMMVATLKKLMALEIPAYSIHDCLLVKSSDKDIALHTYRNTIREYIIQWNNKKKKTVIDVVVPVKIEELINNKKEVERIKGYYN